MSWIEKKKAELGMAIGGVSLNIDIINACPLGCYSCGIGSFGTRRKGVMTIDYFRKLLDKAESEFKVRKVQFYAYSEMLLHKDAHLFIEETTKRGIPSYLSTMLQTTNCDFEKVIEARPTEFRISFPGWKKMEYYQKGAKVEVFNEKLPRVCSLPRHPETTWTCAFHLYNDNVDELPKVKEMAEFWKLKLVPLPAIFMPLEKYVEGSYSEQDKTLMSHLLETPEQAAKTMKRSTFCTMWKQLTIDANGDVFLCQLVYEERFKIGNFMEHSFKDFQGIMQSHPFCGKCMDKGADQLQLCYGDFVKYLDPISEANKKRRIAV